MEIECSDSFEGIFLQRGAGKWGAGRGKGIKNKIGEIIECDKIDLREKKTYDNSEGRIAELGFILEVERGGGSSGEM